MNEHEKYFEEKIKKEKWKSIMVFIILVIGLMWWTFSAIYGTYKFTTRHETTTYIALLEDTVDDKKVEIDQLKKEMENFYEAHVMENFLLMLLNEEQKKQFTTLEDYLKPYMYKKN